MYASLVAQLVKNLPAMQETWVWSLDWEGPPETEMATHPSILAWEVPWTQEPGGLQVVTKSHVQLRDSTTNNTRYIQQ